MSGPFDFLTEELNKRLPQEAQERGVSLEQFVQYLLTEALDQLDDHNNDDIPLETALEESEAKFRALAEHSLVGIYLFQDGIFKYVNPQLSEILGRGIDELIGKSPLQVIHPDDHIGVGQKIQGLMTGRVTTDRHEFRVLTGEDDQIHVKVYGSRFMYCGEPAIIGTVVDITEQKRYEEELIAAKNEAEQMNRLKSSFLANMSHEVRTPITAILGFTDMLAEEVSQAQQQFVEIIQNSGQRLLRTIDAVLYLAQLESGALTLQPDELDAVVVIEETVDRFQERAQQKGLSLTVETPPQEVPATMDQTILEVAVGNLIDNAIKFTEEGRVTVDLTADDQSVSIQVADTGIGIDSSVAADLFEAFRQESTGFARTYEGNGLGLTITGKFVKLAGGTIDIQTARDQGAQFTIRLPRHERENLSDQTYYEDLV